MSLLNQGLPQPVVSPVALAVAQSVAVSVTGAGGWTPRSLYRNGRVGPLYEPSPLTCYSDFLGTPAGVGDAVALQLDTSQDRLRMGSQLSTGSDDLNTAANWTASGTNTVAQDGDEVVITYVDDSNGALLDISGLTDYGLYRLTGTLTASGVFNFGTTNNRTSLTVQGCTAGVNEIDVFFISDGSTRFAFTGFSSGNVARLSGMSLRQVLGYHAYQDTTAARPLLGRRPVTGRRNLITSSEDMAGADWIDNNADPSTGVERGGYTLQTLTEDSVSGDIHERGQNITVAASGVYTLSGVLSEKASGRRYAYFRAAGYDAAGGVQRLSVLLDLRDGTVLDTDVSGAGTGVVGASDYAVTDEGDGAYRVSVEIDTNITTTDAIGLAVGLSNTASPSWSSFGGITYNGDGTSAIYAGSFQIESGSLTAYQRVAATDIDITEAGVQPAYFLRGDGVDDDLEASVPEVTSGHTLAVVGTGVTGAVRSVLSIADSSDANQRITAVGSVIAVGVGVTQVRTGPSTSRDAGGSGTSGSVIGLIGDYVDAGISAYDTEGNSDTATALSLPAGMTSLRLHGVGNSTPQVFQGDIYLAASIDASITNAERTALLDYMRAETPA